MITSEFLHTVLQRNVREFRQSFKVAFKEDELQATRFKFVYSLGDSRYRSFMNNRLNPLRLEVAHMGQSMARRFIRTHLRGKGKEYITYSQEV